MARECPEPRKPRCFNCRQSKSRCCLRAPKDVYADSVIAGHKSHECENEKVEDPRFNSGGGGNYNGGGDSYGNAEPSSVEAVATEGDWASGGGSAVAEVPGGVEASGDW